MNDEACLVYYKFLQIYGSCDAYLKAIFFGDLEKKFPNILAYGLFTVENNKFFGTYVSYSDILHIINAINNDIQVTIHGDKFIVLLKTNDKFKDYIKFIADSYTDGYFPNKDSDSKNLNDK